METSLRSSRRTSDEGSSTSATAPAGRLGRPRLSRRFARRLAVAVALALPLTTACAANFSAETQRPFQPAVGSDNRDGTIYALNLLVVADDDGNGTLVGSLINQDPCPDYVVDLHVVDADGGGVKASPLPSPEDLPNPELVPDSCPSTTAPDSAITLPSQLSVKLPDDAQTQVSADTVAPGTFLTLTWRFARADQLELDVPVVAESDMYAGVTVGPISGTQ